MSVWPPTTKTRIGDISAGFLDHRRLNGDRGADARRGADGQAAAEQVDALLHSQQPDTLAHGGRGIEYAGDVETLAVVGHDDPDHRVVEANLYACVPGTGVAGDVVDSLLHDAEQGYLGVAGKTRRRFAGLDDHLDALLGEIGLAVPPDRRNEAEVVEDGRTQAQYESPRVGQQGRD